MLDVLVDSFKTELQGLRSDGRDRILIAVSLGWVLSLGVRFVYPALVPFLRTEFEIGLTTTGLLLTLLWGAYAIGHVPGGILGDRIGEGNILVLSTASSAVALFVVATAGDVGILFAGTIGFGIATALYGPTRFTLLTDIYTKHSGSAIGVTMAAGSLGSTVIPAVSALLATYVSWRLGFGIFVPLFGATVLVLWWTVPAHTSGTNSVINEISTQTIKRIGTGITRCSIPVVVSIQVSVSFVMQGFVSFYPAYLITMKGLSEGAAAVLFGLFFAAGAIVQPISGSLSERLGMQKTLLLLMGGCVLAFWLLPLSHSLIVLVPITVLFSCLLGCGIPTQTYIADSLPTDMQGTGFGLLKASWMLVGATSPLFIGFLADHGFFIEGFLFLALINTLVLVLSALYLPDK